MTRAFWLARLCCSPRKAQPTLPRRQRPRRRNLSRSGSSRALDSARRSRARRATPYLPASAAVAGVSVRPCRRPCLGRIASLTRGPANRTARERGPHRAQSTTMRSLGTSSSPDSSSPSRSRCSSLRPSFKRVSRHWWLKRRTKRRRGRRGRKRRRRHSKATRRQRKKQQNRKWRRSGRLSASMERMKWRLMRRPPATSSFASEVTSAPE
mmetsp:Transcript_79605/g.165345  ORF Transcript_79605/g.165345 Transcript_79605/m.165345 type:complete len:210 (+) Transcript_79605:429-1058(+)